MNDLLRCNQMFAANTEPLLSITEDMWPITPWVCKNLQIHQWAVKMSHLPGKILPAVRRQGHLTDRQVEKKRKTINKSCTLAAFNLHGLQLPRPSPLTLWLSLPCHSADLSKHALIHSHVKQLCSYIAVTKET